MRKSATEQTASPPELAAAPAGLLDPKEIATRIGLSQSSVHRLMDEGRLPHFRFGRARRVAESDLAEFLDSSRIGARKPKQLGEINRDRLEDDLDESAPPTLYDPRAASTWRIKPVPPKSPGNQRNENGVYEPDVYP